MTFRQHANPSRPTSARAIPDSALNPKGQEATDSADSHRHPRLDSLVDRLPDRLKGTIVWLLKPESRWVRIPASIFLILGGFLAVLPVFGLWMLPLGLLLIAEDVPVVRRGLHRTVDWLERRWPRLLL